MHGAGSPGCDSEPDMGTVAPATAGAHFARENGGFLPLGHRGLDSRFREEDGSGFFLRTAKRP